MKTSPTPHKILIPLLSLTLLTLPGLRAQDQETNSTSTNNACHKWHHHVGGGDWANLSEAEKQELKADFEKIKNDPQLVAARTAAEAAQKTLRETRKQLILQVDPSAQAILDKLHQGTNAPSAPSKN